ncbi:MAG: DUF2169 domain-containing protein [Polyangiaceae bacterium]
MRAYFLAPFPVGVVAFRDPTPRAAFVVKTAYRIVERPWSPSDPRLVFMFEPVTLPLEGARDAGDASARADDFVPRKLMPEIIVVGVAHLSEPAVEAPVEVALGAQLHKRVRVRSSRAARMIPLSTNTVFQEGAGSNIAASLGPQPACRPEISGPRDEIEARWSAGWVDLEPQERGQSFQAAPLDQRTNEVLGPGTVLGLRSLTPRGGSVSLRLPQASPFVLLLSAARGMAGATRLPLRLDTIHYDSVSGTIELVHRGEVGIGSSGELPDCVVGLKDGPTLPPLADLERTLADARVGEVVSPRFGAISGHPSLLPQSSQPRASQPGIHGGSAPAPPPSNPGQARPAALRSSKSRFGDRDIIGRAIGHWRVLREVADFKDRVGYEVEHASALGTHGSGNMRGTLWFATDAAARTRMQHEISLRRRIHHPVLAPILDAGDEPNRGFYVVDALAEGRDLATIAKQDGFLPTAKALAVLDAVLDALSTLHASGLVLGGLGARGVVIPAAGPNEGATPAALPALIVGFALLRSRGNGEPPLDPVHLDPSTASPETLRNQWSMIDGSADVFSAVATCVRAMGFLGPRIAGRGLAVSPQAPMAIRVALDPPLAADPARRPPIDAIRDALARLGVHRPRYDASIMQRAEERLHTDPEFRLITVKDRMSSPLGGGTDTDRSTTQPMGPLAAAIEEAESFITTQVLRPNRREEPSSDEGGDRPTVTIPRRSP